jgi:hypothetical protein
MSKYHGEQYWTEIRHQTQALQGWRELNNDDFDMLRAISNDHEVRARSQRERVRRVGRAKQRDPES